MAPFRPSGRSNRSGRGQVEQNVLEGLPIHQYREVEITIGNDNPDDKIHDKDAWPELPMPRESHLLPEHSQQLLRAARAGRIKRPPPPPDEEKEALEDDEEKVEPQQRGFTIKKFVKVPRHLEGPEPEYLAKRRKGLPSQYVPSAAVMIQQPVRETKVKKVDSEGNVTVYKALVPEGQKVEGEVQEADAAAEEVAAITAAPGTVVEGVGVVNAEGVVVANDLVQQTPPRRKPPPPKKKKRGPGRGHKKVVVIEPGAEGATTDTGTPAAVATLKREGDSVGPSDVDTPMPDAGDDEEGGSGEEGEDDQEGEQTPAPGDATPSKSATDATPQPAIEPPQTSAPTLSAEPEVKQERRSKSLSKSRGGSRDPSSSPDLPLATAVAHSRQNSLNQIPSLPIEGESSAPSAPIKEKEATPAEAPLPETSEPAKPPEEIDEVKAPAPEEAHVSDGEPDLFGSLEAHLEKDSNSMADP